MNKNKVTAVIATAMLLMGVWCIILKAVVPGFADAKGVLFIGAELILLSSVLFVIYIKGKDIEKPADKEEKRPTKERRNNFSYFKNSECECFPCHKTEGEFFNCMFCYCPLYTLGDKCGGEFEYIKDGIKDCSKCALPHTKDGYLHIMLKVRELSEMAKKED